jgi:hypothetical protein
VRHAQKGTLYYIPFLARVVGSGGERLNSLSHIPEPLSTVPPIQDFNLMSWAIFNKECRVVQVYKRRKKIHFNENLPHFRVKVIF